MPSASHSFPSFLTFSSRQRSIFWVWIIHHPTCSSLCLQVVFTPFPHKNFLKIPWLLRNKPFPEVERTPGCWNLQEELEMEKLPTCCVLHGFLWLWRPQKSVWNSLICIYLGIFACVCLWICQPLRDLKFEIKP